MTVADGDGRSDGGEAYSPAFWNALAVEQAGLQAAAGGTVYESSGRTSIYLSALSSGLVAIGFASDSPGVLTALALTIFPTVFVLGWFTVVRLVDTTVENAAARHRIQRIRALYATLAHDGDFYFTPDGLGSTGTLGVRYSRWSILSTMASMVAVVNSVLAGAGTALVFSLILSVPLVVAIIVGTAVTATVLVATLRYERRRIHRIAISDAAS